jgi:Flp pilus assembly protein TadG
MIGVMGSSGRRSASGRNGERGAALVELAVALPLLALILVGTIDFGRAFRTAMVVTAAARAGALYGSQTAINSGDTPGMISRADEVLAANGLATGAATQASRACLCANDTGSTFTGTACSTPCGSGTHLVVSVTVTATRVFSILNPFPGVPSNVTIIRGVTLRAQ